MSQLIRQAVNHAVKQTDKNTQYGCFFSDEPGYKQWGALWLS